MMAKFAAFALDINGTALARYDLAATEKESAEREARQYLERHQVIEVWSDDHRRLAIGHQSIGLVGDHFGRRIHVWTRLAA